MKSRKLSLVLVVTVILVLALVPQAQAAFLCPVVGDGVLNADSHNGDQGVSVITPAVGTSFLPGNNMAGEKADPNAYNTVGPDNPAAGPGHNPDFSPIWPN